MNSEQLIIGIFLGVLLGAWIMSKFNTYQNNKENTILLDRLKKEEHANRIKYHEKELFFNRLNIEFCKNHLDGRDWLALYIADANIALEEKIELGISYKKPPPLKAAEWKMKFKILEYRLQSIIDYFPFVADFEDAIYTEYFDLSNDFDEDPIYKKDQVLRFISSAEYDKLSPADRNQLALERYLNGKLSPQRIGMLYELYIGHLYEKKGWTVDYHGIDKGLEDLGRDLICTSSNGKEIFIVQAKCWAAHKPIRERHIFQLYGTSQLFRKNLNKKFVDSKISMQLVTSSNVSDTAKEAAEKLGVLIWPKLKLDKKFPLIKCNINAQTKEKIYHLPFDQQYDRTVINPKIGEFFALTCTEAEKAGFRRAFRFSG